MQVGPAQASGLICVGDVLVGVGGDRVKGLSFPTILGELRREATLFYFNRRHTFTRPIRVNVRIKGLSFPSILGE